MEWIGILARRRGAGVLLALACVACGGGPRTFEAVTSGAVDLHPVDRAAVERLLDASPHGAEALRVFTADENATGAAPFLRIVEGRVTDLVFSQLRDASAVEDLAALHTLEVAGSFPHFRLRSSATLEELRVLSSGELEALEVVDLPRLRQLVVSGAALDDGLRLAALPSLFHLTCERCGLVELPQVAAPDLGELFLSGNGLSNLAGLERYPKLRMLRLADNDLEDLSALPDLPELRVLNLKNNPLPRRLALPALRGLASLDLRGTEVAAVPASLIGRENLKVRLEGAADSSSFEATLARLRDSYSNAPGEAVRALGATGGSIRASRGDCRWKVSTLSRAEVSCELSFDSVKGLAAARLGETDITLPFKGGGAPRLKVRLSVGTGEAAIYLPESYDLITDARVITGADPETAEAARSPGDRFDGYRKLTVRPGAPAEGKGEATLLGSRVVLWIEGVGGEARDLELTVEPV